MRRRRVRERIDQLGVLAAVALAAAGWPIGDYAVAGPGADEPIHVRWLALGDSYSSGEGIPGAAPGPGLVGGDCRRANGDSSPARAYPVVAYETLRASDPRYDYERPFFVACTGAITDDIRAQLAEMTATVPADLRRWDVVSLSAGGNNIRFKEILVGCVDLNSLFGAFDLSPGCDISEQRLRERVDMLTGRRPIDPENFTGRVNLPDLYDEIARYVAPGGHVVVVGYPQIVEEPSLWSHDGATCDGLWRDDVRMLRSVTGYLNEQIGRAVLEANERHRDDGVEFYFEDISQIYEPSNDPTARHGLCAEGAEWLNGMSVEFRFGLPRVAGSFHPKQLGHDATGLYIAAGLMSRDFGGSAGLPGPGVPASMWPVDDDNEGPMAYYTWLGADFFFPSWVSCAADVCIAGDGSQVLVTALGPLEDYGYIDQDVTEPYAALVAIGLTDQQARDVLTPGEPRTTA